MFELKDTDFHGLRSNTWWKVKEISTVSIGLHSKPRCYIFCICNRTSKPKHSNLFWIWISWQDYLFKLLLNLPHPWDRDLVAVVQHLEVVEDAKRHLLHNFPCSPPARHDFPFSRRWNNDVGLDHQRCLLLECLTCVKRVNFKAKRLFQFSCPNFAHVLANEIVGRKIQAFTAFRLLKLPEDCQLSTREQICRGADEHAVIGLVKLVEDHSYNRVEFRSALSSIQLLDLIKFQVPNVPRVHVLELCGRKELVRQQQMLERDREWSLGLHPSIRDDFDEIVGRHWVVQRHSKADPVLLSGLTLLQDELLWVQYVLIVAVVHKYPEWLRIAMVLWVPGKRLVGFYI